MRPPLRQVDDCAGPEDHIAAALTSLGAWARSRRPDRVVTVVGTAHTGLLGGVEGVARAKGELIEALDALAAMPARQRMAVLGLMAEIEDPPAGHRRVAARTTRLGIEVIAVAVDLYGVNPWSTRSAPSDRSDPVTSCW